jgi:hypothetical protein
MFVSRFTLGQPVVGSSFALSLVHTHTHTHTHTYMRTEERNYCIFVQYIEEQTKMVYQLGRNEK